MVKSKRKKPSKPSKSFPLTAHNNGQWCKKIRGKIHFFGVWEDPQTALDNYLRIASDLHAGRKPRGESLSKDEILVKDICNHFLTYQLQKVEAGEISARWFEDCRQVINCFASFVGSQRIVEDLKPKDFLKVRQHLIERGLTGKRGLGFHALNRAITIIRGVLKHAYELDLIDRPIKYGKAFERPSATLRRKSRRMNEIENGKRLFEAHEIQTMLKNTDDSLKAMILLGINGGLGNTDCARLPIPAVDLNNGVIEFDRPKTGIEREIPLWDETIAALSKVLLNRPETEDEDTEHLVFLTTFGRPWVRNSIHRAESDNIKKVVPIDSIGQEFTRGCSQLF